MLDLLRILMTVSIDHQKFDTDKLGELRLHALIHTAMRSLFPSDDITYPSFFKCKLESQTLFSSCLPEIANNSLPKNLCLSQIMLIIIMAVRLLNSSQVARLFSHTCESLVYVPRNIAKQKAFGGGGGFDRVF